MSKTEYSLGEVECAMVIAEVITEATARGTLSPGLKEAFENWGSGAIRLFIIQHVAPLAQEMMNLFHAQGDNYWSFDWEIMPALVDVLEWEKFSDYTDEHTWLPTPQTLHRQVLIELTETLIQERPKAVRQLSL